ncbi:MAG: hypothetical protein ACOYZ6_01070 [Chloroflexota bacterium]
MRSSLSSSDEPEIERTKPIELFRPLIGTMIGVCILWVFVFLGQDVKQTRANAMAFISPGVLAVIMLNLFFSADIVVGSYQYSIVVAVVSSVPVAILGAMFSSEKYEIRNAAGELFIMYGIFCMVIGLAGSSILYPLLESP